MLTSFVIGSVISWFILSILYLISGLMAIQREEKYIKQSIDLLCKYNGIKIRKGERDIRTSSYYLKLGSENINWGCYSIEDVWENPEDYRAVAAYVEENQEVWEKHKQWLKENSLWFGDISE